MAKEEKDYCPICAIEVTDVGYENHKCNPRTLSAIDAASTRAEDAEISFPQPGLTEKLKAGFAMMNGRDPWCKPEWA